MTKRAHQIFLALALLNIMMFSFVQSALADTGQTLALKGGLLIDGTGSLPVEDAVVLMSDGRIAKIGPKNKIKIPVITFEP
jgi:hypothetical protein